MPRLTAAAIALLALLGGAGAATAAPLASQLERALAHSGFRGAQVGVLVVRAADGAELFARDPDTPRAPASNLKILTALAALAAFGPTHQFTTTLLADAPIAVDGSVGTLAVRGGGDPALTSEELWRLAADLHRLGLRRVRNGLLLDDGYFDREQWNPAWGSRSARAYHAPVAALTANYGAFTVEVAPPARAEGVARIALDPPVPYLELAARVRTGPRTSLAVDRTAVGARNRVDVAGRVRPGEPPLTIVRSVSDPVRYAAAVLRLQLTALGIVVEGDDRVAPTPVGFTELLAFRGKPLAHHIGLLLKWSNNNVAEMLVKNLGVQASGPPGSWTTGLAALRTQLTALGVPQDGLVLADGSGLAASNRVTPRTLVAALAIARRGFAFGLELAAGLPIAGRDGTLRQRARDATDRVRAKTGLINGVATLSGYAITRDGTDVIFSILTTGAAGGDGAAMAANDAFAEALVR